MKKVLLGGALMAVAALAAAGPASAKAVHWNVKCEKIAKLQLRAGIDCAHTVKAGQTWTFPKGVWWQKDFTTTGTALSATFQLSAIGGQGSFFAIGPGAKYGQLLSGEAPVWITARQKMIVVAATKSFKVPQKVIFPQQQG